MKTAALMICLVLSIAGCSGNQAGPGPSAASPGLANTAAPSQPPRPTPGTTQVVSPAPNPADDQYVALADALHHRGVAVWWETDLVARWLEGTPRSARPSPASASWPRCPGPSASRSPTRSATTTASDRSRRPRTSSARPGTHWQRLPRANRSWWTPSYRSSAACPGAEGTRKAAPSGSGSKYPAATAAAVESYLRAGLIDRLDLSTGLLEDSTYAKWGLTRREAQTDAWNRVRAQGWESLTILQSRKALADADGYQGSAGQAGDDAATYVDVPVGAGAKAVDIWTWRQPYQGRTVSLLAPDLSANPLWSSLVQRHRSGVQLITHMTPSTMPSDSAGYTRECDLAATAFTAIFVAAGTG